MSKMRLAAALLILTLLAGCGTPPRGGAVADTPSVTIVRDTLAVTLGESGSASLSPSKVVIAGLHVGLGVDIPVTLSSSEEQSFVLSVREIPDYTEDGYNRDMCGAVRMLVTPSRMTLAPGEAGEATLSLHLSEEVSNTEVWFSALSDRTGERLELCLRCLINPKVSP